MHAVRVLVLIPWKTTDPPDVLAGIEEALQKMHEKPKRLIVMKKEVYASKR